MLSDISGRPVSSLQPEAILIGAASYKLYMYCLPKVRQFAVRFFGHVVAVVLLIAFTAVATPAHAQSASAEIVTGRILNANSGAPIPRVLVQLGPDVAFTDHDGKFVLAGVPSNGGMVMLTKPGYFTSPERTDPPGVQVTAAQLAQPFELRLYPEALLTGTVATQDGAPLSGIQVTARRLATENAVRSFEIVTSVQTDSHGAFRLVVPAGDYQVVTQFVATGVETGLSILPAMAPSGSGSSTFHVGSGEQQQIELRPHTGIPHTVGLSLRGLAEDRSAAFTMSTGNGATWQMGPDSEPDSDDTALHLPAGSYHLSVTSSNGDGLSFGEARLTVPDHNISGIVVQLAPVAPITVEVNVDPHASTASPPSPQELGLQLVAEQQEQGSRRENAIRLQTRPGHSPMLLPRPGQFRLIAAPRSSWYIESASYGGAEVLGQVLTVNAGSGSPPLQLVVNNRMGSLEGRVTTPGGAPADAWVALLPTFASALPMITLRAGSDGSFSLPSLQPGNYLALALEHRTVSDLQDPAVRNGLGLRPQTVSIEPGTRSTLDLEVFGSGSSAP